MSKRGELLQKGVKTVKFLDRMVKMVFYSTFLFTIIVGYVAYVKDWSDILHLLVEKWFDIMVKELVVMGLITMVKEGFTSFVRRGELKYELELLKQRGEEEANFEEEYINQEDY